MEIVTVKREQSNGRRRLEVDAETLPSNPIKFVKRRRREVATAVVGAAGEDNRPEQATDPSSTTTAVKRSSRFRGVSRHRWTGRYEAHLWDKGSWNATQKKKGKQVYLGAYDEEEAAARAYDLAALKYWGTSTFTNFPVSDYEKEIEIMQNMTREEYLASLRRKSSGFSRGVSKYRGVARHHHNGRWEARIGRVFGNKYLYLGTYSTQEEAAAAYDIAAIEYRGINAVTNFDLSTYIRWLRPKTNSSSASQEQPTNCNETRPFPHPPIIFRKEETEFLLDGCNILSNDRLGSPDQKQDYYPLQVPCTPSKSSSSTALSLLLRSSIFQELMEKNSNTAEIKDVEGDDHEGRFHQEQLGNDDDDFGGIFYDGTATDIPYMCSSNATTLPGIELLQEGLPSYCSVAGALDQCFERVTQSLASV